MSHALGKCLPIFLLLSLRKIGWHRIRVHSPHGVLFPSKREPNPSFPVLVLNNPIFTEASDDMLVCF
jgi:hypothetical protein